MRSDKAVFDLHMEIGAKDQTFRDRTALHTATLPLTRIIHSFQCYLTENVTQNSLVVASLVVELLSPSDWEGQVAGHAGLGWSRTVRLVRWLTCEEVPVHHGDMLTRTQVFLAVEGESTF